MGEHVGQRKRRPAGGDTKAGTSRVVAVTIVGLLLTVACSSVDTSTGSVSPTNGSANDSGNESSSSATTTATSTTRETATTRETTTTQSSEPTDDSASQNPCETTTAGTSTFDLDHEGLTRSVQLYVPTSFDGTPLPVVINWHGLGSNGSQQATLSGYETLAESEGFMVAHPTGTPAPGDVRNSWELPAFDTPNRDDVGFAAALIDELTLASCGDPKRVYSTGLSNGGFFTSVLVCELADRIAAAASIAGLTHNGACQPSRPVPYIAFHGTADEVVAYNGGGSSLATGEQPDDVVAFFDQVMPDEFDEFATDFGCGDGEAVVLSPEVSRLDYTDCDLGTPLAFYTINGGGHTWPGSPVSATLENVLGLTTDDIDATKMSWDFFSMHSLD